MDYTTMVQTRTLTAKFCAEVILNDYIPKSEKDRALNECVVLKHQPHITMDDLDIAWDNYQEKNKKWIQLYIAKTLSVQEKKEILNMCYKRELTHMDKCTANLFIRDMLRNMTYLDWLKILDRPISNIQM